MTNLPVGLTCQTVSLRDPALGQRLADVGLDDVAHLRWTIRSSSRCWCETTICVDADRLAVLVAHGDLALGVGAEHAAPSPGCAARVGEVVEDLVGVVDRRRHQLGRLVAGIAEHDALVAGALFLVAGRHRRPGRYRRTGRAVDLDVGVLPVEAVLLVADVLDRHAREVLRSRSVVTVARAAHLAGDDDAVGGGEGLAGDADCHGSMPAFGPSRKNRSTHLVGDAVANLVGMPLRNGLAREQVGLARHGAPHS